MIKTAGLGTWLLSSVLAGCQLQESGKANITYTNTRTPFFAGRFYKIESKASTCLHPAVNVICSKCGPAIGCVECAAYKAGPGCPYCYRGSQCRCYLFLDAPQTLTKLFLKKIWRIGYHPLTFA